MAFSQTLTAVVKTQDFTETFGTWNGTGVTTGDINTGLRVVYWFSAKQLANGSVADQTNIAETGLASAGLAGTAITIDFKQGAVGLWRAMGLS
jgi:hypothetical protein